MAFIFLLPFSLSALKGSKTNPNHMFGGKAGLREACPGYILSRCTLVGAERGGLGSRPLGATAQHSREPAVTLQPATLQVRHGHIMWTGLPVIKLTLIDGK